LEHWNGFQFNIGVFLYFPMYKRIVQCHKKLLEVNSGGQKFKIFPEQIDR